MTPLVSRPELKTGIRSVMPASVTKVSCISELRSILKLKYPLFHTHPKKKFIIKKHLVFHGLNLLADHQKCPIALQQCCFATNGCLVFHLSQWPKPNSMQLSAEFLPSRSVRISKSCCQPQDCKGLQTFNL